MKVLVIINPKTKVKKSGDICKALKEVLPDRQIDLCYTGSSRQARAAAASAAADGYSAVIAVGGDGTVNEVINGLAGSDVALGIIPAGTANDLARQYRLPGNISKALQVIAGNHVGEMDLVEVNGRYYATAGGIGLPCEIADGANAAREQKRWGRFIGRVRGCLLYIAVALRIIALRKNRHNIVKITCDGRVREMDALAVMVDNQATLGGRFRMSPGADNRDGLLDVCLIENSKSRLAVLDLLSRTLRGSHVRLPWVSTFRAARLTIESERPEAYFGDGEVFGYRRRFEIRVAPRALRIFVPEDMGARHGN